MDQAPRVLVTGATGLLGRAVCREFQNNSWIVIGIGFRRARPGILRCDLTDEDSVRGLLQDYKVPHVLRSRTRRIVHASTSSSTHVWSLSRLFQPDVIVHCAAERRPDVVERHTEAAVNLNVHTTSTLAREAGG